MQYFINIAPLPPGKPCNPSSHNQVVIFWIVMPFIICIFLWILGHSIYRGWRLRKQRELVTTASVAFANSDGIPSPTPPISVLPNSDGIPSATSVPSGDNSSGIPSPSSVPSADNSSGIPPPISALSTDNSPVMPNVDAFPPPDSILPSAPPLGILACDSCAYPECNILPSQLVCPSCWNMRPLNVCAA